VGAQTANNTAPWEVKVCFSN